MESRRISVAPFKSCAGEIPYQVRSVLHAFDAYDDAPQVHT